MKKFPNQRYKKFLTVISNLPSAIALIWQAGKWWVIAQSVLLIIGGILPALTVYLTKLFVDTLVLLINSLDKSGNIYLLIWVGIWLAFVTVLNQLLNGIIQLIYAFHAEKLQDHIFSLIHEKSIAVDLAFYEQPEFYDHLHRARNEARTRPIALTTQLGSLFQNSVTLIAMAALLLSYGFWLPLILLISALPAFYVVLRHTLHLHSWQRRKTAQERKVWYHDWLLTNGETAAEVRLFDLGKAFRQKFVSLKENLRTERLKLAVNQKISELVANLIALSLTVSAFAWIIWRTIQGMGTLGDLALFYQAFNQGQNLVRIFLQDTGNLYINSLFIGDLFEFLSLKPKVVNPSDSVEVDLAKGIKFENVAFRYHNNENFILKNFNLFIPANKFVAVVGENGAGKSTLIKLICRFYDPQEGKIKFDDNDLRNFSLEELRRYITVLFQTPVHYSKTVLENIKLGYIDSPLILEEIEAATKSAGADEIIEKLPHQYDQMLGHWFPEGTELSVGEWQRIALARAFFRKSPLILLDEPTSAMDPWAEADWIKKFVRESKGKTVLIITHRFTTAKQADLIYVMEKGEIIESGNHTELLAKNGRYAESWKE